MTIQQDPTPQTPQGKTIHEMDPRQAEQTQKECVCAGCYGQVVAHYNHRTRTSVVYCDTPDCDTPGFVTRRWVEQAQAESLAQKIEARETLRDAAPWMNPHQGKTAEQLLNELGF